MSSIIKVDTIQDQDGNNIINENADTITIGASGDTITIPSGATLTNNGTATGFGLTWQSVQTTGFTAVKGNAYPCNTTSAGFTVTLPATPSAGDQVQLVDYAGTFDSNNLTINPNGNNITGQGSNVISVTERVALTLTYIDATQGWIASSGYAEGTAGFAIPYTADFLVIAGGGGGGSGASSGGGGAGGYRNSYSTETSGGGSSSETSLTFLPNIVYTVTVGGGGAAATNGVDSSISGSNITTITSVGGGAGKASGNAGNSGGSGGGGGAYANDYSTTRAQGTANQGYQGGAGYRTAGSVGDQNPVGGQGGGGGGAGAEGSDVGSSTASQAGAGGNGLASSITGSSTTRAGGGGGGVNVSGTANSGGTGGGGNGSVSTTNGIAGTVNTGSGGGGTAGGTGGAGGKGVVILRMPTANYSGTTTGSPTVSTDGSDTILVFNDSGSYTG